MVSEGVWGGINTKSVGKNHIRSLYSGIAFLPVPCIAKKCLCLGVSRLCLGGSVGVWIISGGVWQMIGGV